MQTLFFLFALLFTQTAHASESATVAAPPTTPTEFALQQAQVQQFPTMLLQDLSDEGRGQSAATGRADYAAYERARNSFRLARILWWGGYGAMVAGGTLMLTSGLLAYNTGDEYAGGIILGAFAVLGGVVSTISGAVLQQVSWSKAYGLMEAVSGGAVSSALGTASLVLLISSVVVGALPSVSGIGGPLFLASYITAELQSSTTHEAWNRFASGPSMRAAIVPTGRGLALVGRF